MKGISTVVAIILIAGALLVASEMKLIPALIGQIPAGHELVADNSVTHEGSGVYSFVCPTDRCNVGASIDYRYSVRYSPSIAVNSEARCSEGETGTMGISTITLDAVNLNKGQSASVCIEGGSWGSYGSYSYRMVTFIYSEFISICLGKSSLSEGNPKTRYPIGEFTTYNDCFRLANPDVCSEVPSVYEYAFVSCRQEDNVFYEGYVDKGATSIDSHGIKLITDCPVDYAYTFIGYTCPDLPPPPPPIQDCGDGVVGEGEVCDPLASPVGSECVKEGISYSGVYQCVNTCQDLICYVGNKRCGNGIVESPETCDRNTKNCVADNGYSGQESCDPETCEWSGSCIATEWCGDNLKNGNEVCDGGSRACSAPNGYDGIQQCNSQCDGYGICTPIEYCGDGMTNGNEQCDGDTDSCYTSGNYLGSKVCQPNCLWGVCSSPYYCGDGIVQKPPEFCDSNSVICTTPTGYAGTQACSIDCSVYGSCSSNEYCGDGATNGNEQCDGGTRSCTVGGQSGTQRCQSDCTWTICTTCPVCPEPSTWGSCSAGQKARTNWRCDSATSYQCVEYTETESCECNVGETKCEGNDLYTCNADLIWDVDPCASGEICVER